MVMCSWKSILVALGAVVFVAAIHECRGRLCEGVETSSEGMQGAWNDAIEGCLMWAEVVSLKLRKTYAAFGVSIAAFFCIKLVICVCQMQQSSFKHVDLQGSKQQLVQREKECVVTGEGNADSTALKGSHWERF
ncbi:hypothetical protein VNO80_07899 [Phaseolus coccineus]|uniref:Uncharacterized protein n=1 Tax=Phaseolus coccineus TaxID=3886 RepID=A0AAN9NQ12_PHACN